MEVNSGKQVEESGVSESFFSISTSLCTNFFGNLFSNKKCNHCKQKLLNSDELIERIEGGKIVYYHAGCSVEREARMEQHKLVMKELIRFFVIREEMIRKAELAAAQAELAAAQAAAEAERVLHEVEEEEPTKKSGIFSKLFSVCRNDSAAQVEA